MIVTPGTTPIGITCSPITVIGAGGSSCTASTVCCDLLAFVSHSSAIAMVDYSLNITPFRAVSLLSIAPRPPPFHKNKDCGILMLFLRVTKSKLPDYVACNPQTLLMMSFPHMIVRSCTSCAEHCPGLSEGVGTLLSINKDPNLFINIGYYSLGF